MYKPEYIIYRQLAYYLRYQYPSVLFHFDQAGLNLSKAQAGMMKAVQGKRGFPDLAILEKRNGHAGLFIEIKPDATKIYKRNGDPATPHIAEQLECLLDLKQKGYCMAFGIGFQNCKEIIDNYLSNKL